jgi:hypothetical protein
VTYDQRVLKVSQPVYQRLTAIRAAMSGEKQRPVTYGEVLEELAWLWESTSALLPDLKEAGR